ncbi:MAG: ANTAR domain-containing protein [Treponema sp.]|nr:ANTAR domain-containing protein [Treponema sp.]MCL2271457.1 ANTAR domain-containing protein [Treponema sp.]
MGSTLTVKALNGCNVLLISCTEKSIALFSDVLKDASIKRITVIASAGEARRTLLENDFDIVIIDAPLADESGEVLARYVAVKGSSQVILAVNSEHFNAVSAVCQEEGILTVSKPVDKNFFWSVLSLAKAVSSKLKRIQEENAKLKQKIEDIRIIDRAKCVLISYLNLTEKEAHRFIEKQAMDLRSAKRVIAEEILKTYAN